MIKVKEGPSAGQQFVLRPGQLFVVGRGKKVAIRLRDPEVSRRHACFELRSQGLFLSDLGSRNGTYLGDVRLESSLPTLIPHGATVRVGNHLLGADLVDFDDKSLGRTLVDREEDEELIPGDEFEILEQLGSGAGGRVWAARRSVPGP